MNHIGFLRNNFIARCFSGCFIVAASLCFNFFGGYLFLLYLAAIGLLMIVELRKMIVSYYGKISSGAHRRLKILEWMLLSIACVLCFIDSMLYIREVENGKWIVTLLFMIVWSTDTCAYISGKLFGKRCLPSYISPSKTYEGLFLSIIMTVIIVYPIIEMMQRYGVYSCTVSHLEHVVFILLLSVTSHCGDLLESVFKRHFMVKDSGSIIPGHGGVLDRFDSMMLASIVMRVYLSI
ncbi:Phosphatidate cytidylyltransferase [Candidatus Fokinia solitaria]|uniref:Phosphatidate cytidylyltransferase n=1 Tax=Candidatus Fokinia solitaria TaxID=1802984 RepID=A0A2U8BSY9_9RICK|nr:phosphatidate cytidylyltransferase [Candidatus Fokinia solitaria]AWD33425.1 Phosphatidate cytidylyltransferase [Candidatus Fokinia solitaria]